MKLIVGLGNPGEKYNKTRHNLGFAVLDELTQQFTVAGVWFMEKKFKSEILEINQLSTTNSKLLLAKPQTYMNNSGMAVRQLADYFKIATEDIIIVHDDLDLPLGKIKIRLGGAAAGHHGVESIISALGTDQFIRIRLGIGNPDLESSERGGQSIDVDHFVLEKFTSKERSKVKRMIKEGAEALELLLQEGLEKAQNQYN